MNHPSHELEITAASDYLRKLANKSIQVYKAMPTCRAILLTGSASEGVSDEYSDLDIILYYDELPSEAAFLDAMQQNGGTNQRIFGERTDANFGEQYRIQGVECQFGHTTIAEWERDIDSVLKDLDVKSPTQKALGGMEEAIPLHGADLIQKWKTTLEQYPDALRDAMIQQHMAFFPLWGLQDRLEPRDATLWVHQVLVENSYNLLAVLAGLNRLYFSQFQFKRMHRYIDKMQIKPDNFAERIEQLFQSGAMDAAQQMEHLVDETLALVAEHAPHIDVTRGRARIGWRHLAWKIEEL